MSTFTQFEGHQYLNIETFRKNGQGVKTPVWFVAAGNVLYVWAQASSGKAKRIRRDGAVKIAPSRGDGAVLGEWVSARAAVDTSPAALAHLKTLMGKKYGLMFTLFGLMGKLRKTEYTAIKIQPA